MAIKLVTESPKISDTIRFELKTPDADDCYTTDPYKFVGIKIYYIERDYQSTNFGEFEKPIYNETLLLELEVARNTFCANPTEDNAFEVERIQNELISKSQSTTYYYKDAVLVEEVGSSAEPIWFSGDPDDEIVTKTDTATFTYDWSPRSRVREGNFFICWTWQPLIAGDTISDNIEFSIAGDGRAVQTIPTHIVDDEKYLTLLEKYLPECYKEYHAEMDITPDVGYKLNQSIASGFTDLEGLANQIIDLFDANVIHESLLVYLSNFFNLKLKSDDPTLWRRQIKQAVPLFKKKGTLKGLEEAFAQAGMSLEKYTRLWQVVSPYTWQQSFRVASSPTFKLYKQPVLPIDENNFGVWIRREDEDEYTSVPSDCVQFTTVDCEHFVTWIGDDKSSEPILLFEGDILRVLYQYAEIPTGGQTVEDYIRELPLSDDRDEADQEYPPKNWNVRLIEEDDPLYDTIVPTRHPFHEKLVYGKIRTEFPYSENIYNMDEYNGSTRDTNDVCFMDKDFIDPCGSCLSSKYNVDVAIENLSDERIAEVYDILREYTAFTTVPFRVAFSGEIVDFVNPPVEEIEMLIKFDLNEYVIAGGNNDIFNRVMEDGLTSFIIDREDLAEQVEKVTGLIGTAYNFKIAIVTPNVELDNVGLILNNHILEILSPSSNSGTYEIASVSGNTGIMASSVSEPLIESSFTFNLSNIVFDSVNASITQQRCAALTDESIDLASYSIRTTWDLEYTPDYTGGVWTIEFPDLGLTYDIERVEGDQIFLPCESVLTEQTGVSYVIYDDSANEVVSSDEGVLEVTNRGRVDFHDSGIEDIAEFVHRGDIMVYDGSEYLVDRLYSDNDVSVLDYEDGDAAGISVQFLRRLATNEVGYFQYQGLKLLTGVDHETAYAIQNGSGNPTDPDDMIDDSTLKENFLIKIGSYYYKIDDIQGTLISLAGYPQNWGTLGSGGTLVNYDIYQFVKDTFEVQFTVFDESDRGGKDVVIRSIESSVTGDVAVTALAMPPGQGIEDIVRQEENISYTIQYKSGEVVEGEIQ